ncbi:dTDP-4-dehydrorhamnose 3,5-epimerase family protein [candidate division WOR-3 bacterium]|nr:dTDP-4-dehydrorhamnose 3,5-epimerase family protein [candidate division WOR-3 bacterium]
MISKSEGLSKVAGVKGKVIKGITIKQLKKIPDERGCIYHMLRSDDLLFEKFGEIYFSVIYPMVIKGWHLHEKMTLNYAVVQGMIKLVLYDDREDSPTKGNLMELFIGEENYCLVKIPPKIWNGFKGIGNKIAIVANCATLPHDPNEIKRMEPFTNKIPYDWGLKHG